MALLAIQQINNNGGTTLTANAAAAGGDTFNNDGATMLAIRNGSGSSINVTAAAAASSVQIPGGGSVPFANTVVAVGAGATAILGPFAPNLYNTGGLVSLTYSAVTTVTVSPFKISAL